MSVEQEKDNPPELTEESELTPVESADSDLPPIESLRPGSDLGAFFSPEVSAELRKRALRAVFRQGRFNIRDGLDDYDEDYTAFPALARAPAELRKLLAERSHPDSDSKLNSGPTSAEPNSGEPTSAEPNSAGLNSGPESESQTRIAQTDSESESDSDSESQLSSRESLT